MNKNPISPNYGSMLKQPKRVSGEQYALTSNNVKMEWRNLPFSEAVLVNPSVRLNRGTVYPFVDMNTVQAGHWNVRPLGQRKFDGGGTRFQDGDTLMARITPSLEHGKIARYCAPETNPYAHGSTEFIVIRGRPNVTDNGYVCYLTKWDGVRNYAISQMTGTSGRQRVPTSSLNHLVVPIPPLHEQHTIVNVLNALDAKIELNRRIIQTLEEMAQTLFKSWFIDFDPVRAKLDGRWLPTEALLGLPARLYNFFPDKMTDSEQGAIPEGWAVEPLNNVIELHDSTRIPLNSRQRAQQCGCYPYYGATGIMDYVDDFLFQGVYVLAGEDGSVVDASGHPVLQYVWGQFWVNNHAHVIKGRNGISEEYLYLILRYQNIQPFITGAVQPKLSQKNLKSIPIVLPDPPTRRAFDSLIQPLFISLRNATDELSTLAAQRDVLLPKLISGEVRVKS